MVNIEGGHCVSTHFTNNVSFLPAEKLFTNLCCKRVTLLKSSSLYATVISYSHCLTLSAFARCQCFFLLYWRKQKKSTNVKLLHLPYGSRQLPMTVFINVRTRVCVFPTFIKQLVLKKFHMNFLQLKSPYRASGHPFRYSIHSIFSITEKPLLFALCPLPTAG